MSKWNTQRNGGESLFNYLTAEREHPKRGMAWKSNGFTIANESYLQVVPEAKLEDLRQRTVDKNAIPCIIPVIGNSSLNSEFWVELKKQLEIGNIKFLCDAKTKQEELEENGRYFELTTDELTDELLPYGQTELLIKEATELQTEIRDNKIKLSEPRSGTKDRAVCLAYGNAIASKIENQYLKSLTEDDFDIDDIQLVY